MPFGITSLRKEIDICQQNCSISVKANRAARVKCQNSWWRDAGAADTSAHLSIKWLKREEGVRSEWGIAAHSESTFIKKTKGDEAGLTTPET